ncbi:MAG: HAD family phosphatase [Candidatus Omnitrophica bacterium]|nr:HAD family phosphatase [Candidatus Omnitrophota bacterium]
MKKLLFDHKKRSQPPKKRAAKIKAIVFDLGNVLLNYDILKAARWFHKTCGVSILKIRKHFFAAETEKAYERGEISTLDFFEYAKQAFKVPIDFESFKNGWNDIFWENDGMDELTGKLSKTYPLYLISNTNEMHFDYIEKKFGILRHFKETFPSHRMGARKPEPKIYAKTIERIGVRPEEMVFIDDVPKFVRGAKKAGMHGIQFRNKKQLIRDLKRLGVNIS